MRGALIIAVAAAACGRDGAKPDGTSASASSAPYCRRAGAVTALPAAGLAGAVGAAMRESSLRPLHTFSIVARDPATGDLGVAVQSHWFAVGTLVTWAEPGVGAIATQSFVEPSYGPLGLALMRDGVAAADALAKLVAGDAGRDVRQVAFVDAAGRVGVHTGAKCIEHAGHATGDGYSVQANMMGTDQVVRAMAGGFEAAKGDLADRMLAALDAAQAAGGDIRGCQSAALVVVRGVRSERPWADRVFDLRVDDSPAPLPELRRLLRLARAYAAMNAGDAAVEKGDMAAALAQYGAAADMTGGDTEMLYWQAVALAAHGEVERSIPLFRRVFAADPRWIELTRRLHKPGIIPDNATGHALVEQILREAR